MTSSYERVLQKAEESKQRQLAQLEAERLPDGRQWWQRYELWLDESDRDSVWWMHSVNWRWLIDLDDWHSSAEQEAVTRILEDCTVPQIDRFEMKITPLLQPDIDCTPVLLDVLNAVKAWDAHANQTPRQRIQHTPAVGWQGQIWYDEDRSTPVLAV